jgi:hypothetical protein
MNNSISPQKNPNKILPFLLYLGTYTITSFIHMMSVHEGNVAFGLSLATFHGYSFIVIYSLLVKFMENKPEESSEDAEKIEEEEDLELELVEAEKGKEDNQSFIVYIN